jgi:hypothetical protein
MKTQIVPNLEIKERRKKQRFKEIKAVHFIKNNNYLTL